MIRLLDNLASGILTILKSCPHCGCKNVGMSGSIRCLSSDDCYGQKDLMLWFIEEIGILYFFN